MPIYEFHCEKCEAGSEILVRSSERENVKCPKCGSPKLTKKFSTFASSVAGGGVAAPAPACASKRSACGCGRGGPHRH